MDFGAQVWLYLLPTERDFDVFLSNLLDRKYEGRQLESDGRLAIL